MPADLRTGTVLIKEGTPFPEGLTCESEPCAPGWRLVQNLDAQSLDRRLHEAGWTFFHIHREINLTVFGFDERKTARKAVQQILANLNSEKSNSLEFKQVVSLPSARFLGVTYLTVCAHSRDIKENQILSPS
jgi:hypothetical protein